MPKFAGKALTILSAILLAACEPAQVADGCSGFAAITVTAPLVKGSARWQKAVDDGMLLRDAPGDVLTPSTAGQITAHDKAFARYCGQPK